MFNVVNSEAIRTSGTRVAAFPDGVQDCGCSERRDVGV